MFELLNNNKFFTGVTMLAVNLGSKYLAHELSESQQELFNNKIIRRFILFTVVFMATKDIYVSLILTAVFIVIVSGLFHEDSPYCIVKKPKKTSKKIKREKYLEAQKIVQQYELQELNKQFN
tara:strand:+ start:1642 stop:2007 length:366 start_codon:yes stop_codon:yes gene_type:complete